LQNVTEPVRLGSVARWAMAGLIYERLFYRCCSRIETYVETVVSQW
jgi:hypothetical protein